MKNILSVVFVVCLAVLLSGFAIAQQPVAPPPKPAVEAGANAEVLRLLRAGVSERAILHLISAAAGTYDTSADALAVLKQAGASEAELSAIAAKGAAPSPQPSAAGAPTTTGPSLAETMQFIQDKLSDLGKISFVMFEQIASIGSTGTEAEVHQTVPLTNEISNVVADQNQCRISYHRKLTINGKTYMEEDSVFSLRDVQDIVIMPYEQDQKEWDPKNNYPNEIITSTSPPITALVVRRPHGEENTFRFTDANLASRVAKAMIHAVELCGGGSKPEPF